MDTLKRLNYIGSKYQLLPWLKEQILAATGWPSLAGKRVADLFAGTGVVSFFLRTEGAATLANDLESYAALIAKVCVRNRYTPVLEARIAALNQRIAAGEHRVPSGQPPGFITRHYSPAGPDGRKFFTEENARRIDFLRAAIAAEETPLQDFLRASLLVSADAVANVASTYGCYLKSFKAVALKELVLTPVHRFSAPVHPGSAAFHGTAVAAAEQLSAPVQAVYLDPPYNQRQYSKNYFPLSMILVPSSPTEEAAQELAGITGVTGIPASSSNSLFCRKKEVETALRDLVASLAPKTEWLFLSYSNEGILTREKIEEILRSHGTVTVAARPHKRFKAYEYNETAQTEEYLFCLRITGVPQ